MTPDHVRKVVQMYTDRLDADGIVAQRMDPSRTFQSLSKNEILQHARHLCDNVMLFSDDCILDELKAARHLAALQMTLSFAGWYTLNELMSHNRSSFMD